MALRHIFISEDPYIFRFQVIKATYWTIAGLITLLTVVNFVYNDSDGETLSGAFFVSIMLILFLQIIFLPLYLVVKAISLNYLVNLELEKPLEKNKVVSNSEYKNWVLPSSSLLGETPNTKITIQKKDSKQSKEIVGLVKKFGCKASLLSIDTGPQIDTYHFKPDIGERVQDPEKLRLAIGQTLEKNGVSVRVDETLHGLFHIEVVRDDRQTVYFKDIVESEEFTKFDTPLPFIVGVDPTGKLILSDLSQQPHMFISGQTGSGKSTFIDTLLLSLLFKKSPNELKLILIDPKMVQLTPYNDIPHLMYPIILDPEKSMTALRELVDEMEVRLHTLAESRTRNIEEYNDSKAGHMPYIVLVIGEFADLMMALADEVEALTVRLMQKSRAVGIHLVFATQRPSVDVITGLIKANAPARIAFTVVSKVDSRTIIDEVGAEMLLGKGDLLFRDGKDFYLSRAQAPYVSPDEITNVTNFLRTKSNNII